MKKIDKWVTRDGAEFNTEEKALAREELLDKVDYVYNMLPKHPDNANFVNGHGYIQHKEVSILKARARLIELAETHAFSEISSYDIRSYAFGRYLDDNNSVLYKLYNRIASCKKTSKNCLR